MGSHLRVPEYVACQCELSCSHDNNSDRKLFRYEEHTVHACEQRLCPITCQLCKRLCSGHHFHGTSPGENHLCGYAHFDLSSTMPFTWTSSEEHLCSALCADGICQIDTTPQSIKFSGRYEIFQYSKVRACLSNRLHECLQRKLEFSECVILHLMSTL